MRYYQDKIFPLRLILIDTPEGYAKVLDALAVAENPFPTRGGAHTMLVSGRNSGVVVLVVIDGQTDETALGLTMTLVHESVHVKQYLMREIGEELIGAETEAYAIGCYAKYLTTELMARKAKRAEDSKKLDKPTAEEKQSANRPKRSITKRTYS